MIKYIASEHLKVCFSRFRISKTMLFVYNIAIEDRYNFLRNNLLKNVSINTK